MGTDTEKFAPYAPLAPVIALIRRRREKTLPDPLNSERLAQMSISEGNITRVLQALRFLNLIDEDGHQTESFNRIARAKEQEYPEILAEIIRSAYHEAFTIVDTPDKATDIELRDAFRFYQPETQRPRMIILFRGLCQEAGLIKGGPPTIRMRGRSNSSGKPSSSSSNGARKTQPQPKSDTFFQAESSVTSTQPDSQSMPSQEYALMQGLVSKLPAKKQWTQQERKKWLNAMAAMVDLLIEVTDPSMEDPSMEEMRF